MIAAMPFQAGAPLLLRQIELLGWIAFGAAALLILALSLGLVPMDDAVPPIAIVAGSSLVCRAAALLLYPEEVLAQEDRSARDSLDGGRHRENLRLCYPFFYTPVMRRIQGAGYLALAAAAATLLISPGV